MSISPKTNSFLGSIGGRILSVFGRMVARPTAEDLRRMEFKASTQHLGVRFTEKVRNVFRFKWLRLSLLSRIVVRDKLQQESRKR